MRLVRSRPFRLIILAVSLFVIFTLPRSIYTLWKRKDIVKDHQKTLEQVKRENEQLKRDLAEAETPEFIERVAREKLGMLKDGEAIVLLPSTESAIMVQTNELNPTENFPRWKQWWRLFF